MATKRRFVWVIGVCLCCTGFVQAQQPNTYNRKPNIIFILADDMGYGDVSALNPNSKIRTPNLDALVKGGMYFTEAYTGSALCTPSRYAFITGRYPFRTKTSGVLGGYSVPLIEYSRATVASTLKKAGYTTAIIGKWHLGLQWEPKDPLKPIWDKDGFMPENLNVDYTKSVNGLKELGFDYHYVSPAGNNLAPFTFISDQRVTEQPTEFLESQVANHGYETRRNGGAKAPGFKFNETLTTITNQALTYLDKTKSSGDPFFLYFALTSPHFPWSPSDDFKGKSAAGLYGDYVEELDHRVGQLLEKLKSLNILDNTLIVFSADNGGAFEPSFVKYHHDMNFGRKGQKRDIWQGGQRVPFIVQWGNVVKAGSVSHEPICFTDMLRTFASIAGHPVDANSGPDGFDVSSIFYGNAKSPMRGPIVSQAAGYQELAIISNKWKLVPYGHGDKGTDPAKAGEPKGMLFNLAKDSLETSNVYEQYPDKVKELTMILENYKKEQK